MPGDGSKENAKFEAEAQPLVNRLPKLQDWAENRCLSGRTTERAFIIEFAGMPKAGKSQAIETIRHFFSHGTKRIRAVTGAEWETKFKEGYTVHTPAEGVSLRTPNYLKPNLWDFNAWAGAYALQELLQARHDRYHDLVILDRGPWDAGCWLQYVLVHRRGDIHLPENAEKIVEFFQLPHWATLSDLHVVLTVDPDDAKTRESKQRLIEHGGFASNRAGMETMLEIYKERFESLRTTKVEHCGSLKVPTARLVHTTGRKPKAVALEIIRAALDLLEAKLANLPSKQPISKTELQQALKPWLEHASERLRREFDSYTPTFLNRANQLPDKKRQFVRSRILDLTPSESFILNRDPASDAGQIRTALEEILREAEAQGE